MSSDHKYARGLRKLAKEYDCELVGGGKKHYRFVRAGIRDIIAAGSPRDLNDALKLAEQQLRRAVHQGAEDV